MSVQWLIIFGHHHRLLSTAEDKQSDEQTSEDHRTDERPSLVVSHPRNLTDVQWGTIVCGRITSSIGSLASQQVTPMNCYSFYSVLKGQL